MKSQTSVAKVRITKGVRFAKIISWIIGYCIRHRINPACLSRINPDIPLGGKILMSKSYTYDYFIKDNTAAKKYFVKTIRLPAGMQWPEAKDEFKKLSGRSDKPIVLKPDRGARSIGVKVTTNDLERIELLRARKKVDYAAQEYIPYKHELGLFYYKYPEWKKGKILGIAEKQFRNITGDGKSTLKILLKHENIPKAVMAQLLHQYKTLEYIPKLDEQVMLINTADHDNDGDYNDRPDLITRRLEKTINEIMRGKKVYFCRFDIRARSFEEFKEGKGFKILEANIGSGAVLLHAFDQRYSSKKQLEKYHEGLIHAFNIAERLKNNPRARIIPYIWYMLKDEIPLYFLKHRINKIKLE